MGVKEGGDGESNSIREYHRSVREGGFTLPCQGGPMNRQEAHLAICHESQPVQGLGTLEVLGRFVRVQEEQCQQLGLQ